MICNEKIFKKGNHLLRTTYLHKPNIFVLRCLKVMNLYIFIAEFMEEKDVAMVTSSKYKHVPIKFWIAKERFELVVS